MPPLPLQALRVLDLTHYLSGPFCTRMLAGFGAEVLKIERPRGGDPARRLSPFYQDYPHPEKSGIFLYLNVNKKSITLNLKTSKGVGIFRELVQNADLIVENFRPGVMERLGISFDALRGINPTLIMTSISNFGQTGPYRNFKASEITLFGMGGPMQPTGLPGRSPVKLGGNIVQYQAGAVAALLTTIAVFSLEAGRDPGHIDLSIMETQAGTMDRWMPMLMAHAYTGTIASRAEPGAAWGVGNYPCKDGYVNLLNPTARGRVAAIMEMIGHPELLEDPHLMDEEGNLNMEVVPSLQQYFLEWVLGHSMSEIVREANSRGLMAGPVYTIRRLLEDPHFLARDVWTFVDHPCTGRIKSSDRPAILSKTPWQTTSPAPLLGQHNGEILGGELGYTSRDLVRLRQQGVI